MIIGIGTDLVSIKRINQLILRFGNKFEQKIFTKNEITQANKIKIQEKKILFYAKRFAAKESFSKAIGTGIGRGLNFSDIEIFNQKSGKPEIKIVNDKQVFLEKLFKSKNLFFHLSLSDEKNFASAFVIIEKK
jgi:holo-[acyl-carrier protein] synthase